MPRTVSAYSRSWIKRRAEAHMTDTIKVIRAGSQVLDRTTGMSVATDQSTIYWGNARIHEVQDSGYIVLGESDIPVKQVDVSIPFDSFPVPDRDDVVLIITSVDPDLVGRKLRVIQVDAAGLLPPARKMTCTWIADNQTFQRQT